MQVREGQGAQDREDLKWAPRPACNPKPGLTLLRAADLSHNQESGARLTELPGCPSFSTLNVLVVPLVCGLCNS